MDTSGGTPHTKEELADESTTTYVIDQLKELDLTITDELGRDIKKEAPSHAPSDAFPYRIRIDGPTRFLGTISDGKITLFPEGYEIIPQHLLVEWAITGILRPLTTEKASMRYVDDSEF